MKYTEKLKQTLIGHVVFPLSNLLCNRKKILTRFRKYLQTDHAPQEILQQLQKNKMKQVLLYAHTYIPYYKDLFKQIHFHPHDFTDFKDLKQIPALTRQDVITQYRSLVDIRYAHFIPPPGQLKRALGEPIPFALFRRNKLIKNTSSGSTGAPTLFFEDGSITAANWVNELRLRSWFGVDPGAREARFTRSSVQTTRNKTKAVLRKHLWNQLLLPGINLSLASYANIYEQLRIFEPEVLWGYTSSIVEFGRYLSAQNKSIPTIKPKVCITWAAPLFDHERTFLEEKFQCPVTNVYGSREVGHIAAQCPHNRFHVNQETVFVETDTSQFQGNDDSCGELLATTLEPTIMPFVRYRMGDIGSITEAACTCGRTLQVMDRFIGRTGELFFTKDNRMIAPNFWCRIFMHERLALTVTRFQIRYTHDKNIKICIVKNNHYTEQTELFLKQLLEKEFHSDTDITIEYTEVINSKTSDKYAMVVQETTL